MSNYEIATLIVVSLTSIIALINYNSSIKQTKFQNTIYLIESFENSNNWITKDDRQNWNEILNLMNQTCAKFAFSENIGIPEKFKGCYGNREIITIKELFTEGAFQGHGYSISNILATIEFIATETIKNKLDKSLINFRLIDYIYLANCYNMYLNNKKSNTCKLYKKLNYNIPVLSKGLFCFQEHKELSSNLKFISKNINKIVT